MFSGVQEILLIALIIGAIVLIPRMTAKRGGSPSIVQPRRHPQVPRSARLFIVVSLFWIAGFALYFKPWQQDPTRFIALGLGPVAAAWGIKWIVAGREKRNPRN